LTSASSQDSKEGVGVWRCHRRRRCWCKALSSSLKETLAMSSLQETLAFGVVVAGDVVGGG
jgi:hypothetical protein